MTEAELQADNIHALIKLRRGRDGIHLNIRVSPDVEGFFRKWSGEIHDPVYTFGRMWSGENLRVWGFRPPNENGMENINPNPYTLGFVGGGLTTEEGTINLSFLRLVGASEGEGISLNLDTVMSFSALDRITQRMTHAIRSFYIDYLQPAEFESILESKTRRKVGDEQWA